MPYEPPLDDLISEARAEANRRDTYFSRLVTERRMNPRQRDARVRAMECVAEVLAELRAAGCVRPVCPHCGFGVYRLPEPRYFCPSCGCEFGGDAAAGTPHATVTHTA